MRIVGVIQARFGSSRLPGKVLRPVVGAPMLARMLERVRASAQLDDLVVATTVLQEDQPIQDLCMKLKVRCYAGHPSDLLDRHFEAALSMRSDAIVKIPSDCPLIDPRIVDRVIGRWRDSQGDLDFLSNLHPATYPDGNDVEVIPMNILEIAWREAQKPHEREHTTPFIWDQPSRFRVGNVVWETGLNYSMSHRLTVDYIEDYHLVCAVYDALYGSSSTPFALSEILGFLQFNDRVFRLNAHLAGVNWYRHHLSALQTVSPEETAAFKEA